MSNGPYPSAEEALADADETVEERLIRLRAEAEAISEEMSDLPSEMRHALDEIEDRIAELYDVVAVQATHSVETVEEIIETRPWISVAVAFGAGALATLLLSRPRARKRGWGNW
ncbi:MAG TPA: hypothetical protein VIJ85_05755 [Rhizomicrobium sp.]